VRLNLGMSDSAEPGQVNLNVLAGGRAAIQIVASKIKSEGQDESAM